jgi:hypothetical protein
LKSRGLHRDVYNRAEAGAALLQQSRAFEGAIWLSLPRDRP